MEEDCFEDLVEVEGLEEAVLDEEDDRMVVGDSRQVVSITNGKGASPVEM